MKRRIAVLLSALLLLLPLCAGAEETGWTCALCGQENSGNFCTNCGTARPGAEVIEGVTQIPGETDRVSVDILRIDGSSWVKDKKDKYLHEPAKAIDGKEETCWMVSARKSGKKAPWLAMVLDGQTVDELWIKNGFRAVNAKGKDQYPLYARLKDIHVVFTLEETSVEMSFTLSDERNDGWEKLDTGRIEGVYDITVTVESVYKGSSRAATACLSEFMPVQKAPAENARPPLE